MSRTMSRLGWVVAAATGLLLLAAAAGIARGGPLDPANPPAATRSQIEPRIPISQLPFTISTPGSYYLTQSLSNANGITIASNDVTLDLNGFTLTGVPAGTGVAATIYPSRNITVRNGVLTNWGTGVDVGVAGSSRVEQVTVRYYTSYAILIGTDSALEDCVVDGVGVSENGVSLGTRSVMRRCSVIGNKSMGVRAFDAVTIEDNQILDNGTQGVGFAGLYLPGTDVTIRRNHFASFPGRDIYTAGGIRATVVDNVMSNCTSITLGGGGTFVFAPLQGQSHSNVTHSNGYCP